MPTHQITLYAPQELLQQPAPLAQKLARGLCLATSARRLFARHDNYWLIDSQHDVRVQFEPQCGVIRIITRYRYRLRLVRQSLTKLLTELGCREAK